MVEPGVPRSKSTVVCMNSSRLTSEESKSSLWLKLRAVLETGRYGNSYFLFFHLKTLRGYCFFWVAEIRPKVKCNSGKYKNIEETFGHMEN